MSGQPRFLHVLVIDDNELVRRSTRRAVIYLLKQRGIDSHVSEAESADEGAVAIDMARSGEQPEGPIHLVVSDQTMPGMSGTELLRHLREAGRVLPFILHTDRANPELSTSAEILEQLERHGAFLISKPASFADYERVIVQALCLPDQPPKA